MPSQPQSDKSTVPYAEALGTSEEANKLKSVVSDIYKADEYSSRVAESAQKATVQG